MQTKTVRNVIRKKMDKWLATIPDTELRDRVKSNILVSGGCIASMLLNEDVNDFDVYIMDQDVLRDLCEHYVPGLVLDGREKDKHIAEFIESKGWTPDDISEGYNSEAYVRLRTLKPEQIKVNVSGWGKKGELQEDEAGEPLPYQLAFASQNALSLTDDIQIVTRFSGSAEEIHKNFDFIHATNYYTTAQGLVLNQPALESLLTRRLQYNGSLYPLTSIIRMKKFILRKWGISAGEILKILFQVSKLDLENPDVLEEQLIGVDVAYFSTLIRMIRDGKLEEGESYENFLRKLIDTAFDGDTDEG
jgi:hypothetical protein